MTGRANEVPRVFVQSEGRFSIGEESGAYPEDTHLRRRPDSRAPQ
jgi:hypothetical protein